MQKVFLDLWGIYFDLGSWKAVNPVKINLKFRFFLFLVVSVISFFLKRLSRNFGILRSNRIRCRQKYALFYMWRSLFSSYKYEACLTWHFMYQNFNSLTHRVDIEDLYSVVWRYILLDASSLLDNEVLTFLWNVLFIFLIWIRSAGKNNTFCAGHIGGVLLVFVGFPIMSDKGISGWYSPVRYFD
jgi:hypothetical protein